MSDEIVRPIDRFARKQAWTFRGKGPNGRNLCHCGCGREVMPPRRSCFSDECLAWYTSHSSPDHIRSKVEARDKGVCALCGKDTTIEQRIDRETTALWQWLARRAHEDLCLVSPQASWQIWQECQRWVAEQRKERGWTNEHWWEADHIIPVIEGGGGCDFTGYRTLCLPCHRKETSALAARRAKKRKESFEAGGVRPQAVPAGKLNEILTTT